MNNVDIMAYGHIYVSHLYGVNHEDFIQQINIRESYIPTYS